MLTLHDCSAKTKFAAPKLSGTTLPPRTVWIDLVNAEADEIAYVERVTGLHVPTLEELSEIENSSRLHNEKGTLYLSAPVVARVDSGSPETTSLGFVLTRQWLITMRFVPLTVFTNFAEQTCKPGFVHASSIGVFMGLMDAIIDRAADVLEGVSAELDAVSHRVFGTDPNKVVKPRHPAQEDASLREILHRIGRNGDLASKIRDSLLGLGRVVPYVATLCADWIPAELKPQLDTQKQDIASLSDYDLHLTNKVQLLLDATLGLINIEQNNIIKVLTVVSVVGVPPTLVASMYGMNFHNMPELSWEWGYPYALALIVLSAVGPYLWFKLRGWL